MRWLVITLLLLAACQPTDMPADHATNAVESEEQFIVNMIPHHQEAVDTARLMLNSLDPEMPEFANAIITAQEAEIAMMNQWLVDWYPDHKKATYMNMMPELDPSDLTARDYVFLVGMIDHHRGAIQMAEQVLKLNPRPGVKEFAEKVIKDQSAEVDKMLQWIDS